MNEQQIISEIKRNTAVIGRNLSSINHFILAELVMALEGLGFLAYAGSRASFTVSEAAKSLELRIDFLSASCEFLAEHKILMKTERDTFRLALDENQLRWFSGFLLTYKDTFESLGDLLSGRKLYGRDITRNDLYLSHTNFITRGSIPHLVKRFRELDIHTVTAIGWDDNQLLSILSVSMPDVSGVGVEVVKGGGNPKKEKSRPTAVSSRFVLVEGMVEKPESFPRETKNAEVVVGTLVFHEFFKNNLLVPLLKRYKQEFPHARLFIVELDDVPWDDLHNEPEDSLHRKLATVYKFTHSLINHELLPQYRNNWFEALERSGWKVVNTEMAPARLIIFECE